MMRLLPFHEQRRIYSGTSTRDYVLAKSQGASIQTSRSSVVRITGIAFGWIGATSLPSPT
jgi:hypothetical protein